MKPGDKVTVVKYKAPLPGVINHTVQYEGRVDYYVRSECGGDVTGPFSADELDPQDKAIRYVPAFICNKCGSELQMLKLTTNNNMCYFCGETGSVNKPIWEKISKKVSLKEFEERVRVCKPRNTTY